MLTKITALDIAKYISLMTSVEHIKLQKLLYYCQGIHLARKNECLFDDEIEAWNYGPVVPVVYEKYKNDGYDKYDIIKENDDNINENLSEEYRKTIDMVIAYYGSFLSDELVLQTHSEAPWKDNYKPNRNKIIPIIDIKKYFKETIEFDD